MTNELELSKLVESIAMKAAPYATLAGALNSYIYSPILQVYKSGGLAYTFLESDLVEFARSYSGNARSRVIMPGMWLHYQFNGNASQVLFMVEIRNDHPMHKRCAPGCNFFVAERLDVSSLPMDGSKTVAVRTRASELIKLFIDDYASIYPNPNAKAKDIAGLWHAHDRIVNGD